MTTAPLAIIGAGIGGSTLAQCLLKRGIPCILYEKSPATPRHSYGITLVRSAFRPLAEVLRLDEKGLRQRLSVDRQRNGIGKVSSQPVGISDSAESASFRANCWELEQLLHDGLDIKYEHPVDRLEMGDNGVAIHFNDGNTIESAQIFAAEGPHSRSRRSVLPNTELEVLPYVAFNGKRRVTHSIWNQHYASTFRDACVVETRKDGVLLNIQINDMADQDTISISWVFSRPSKGPSDILFKPNRPNAGASDVPEEFFQEIQRLPPLDQPFKDVFDIDKLRKERILSWLMRTADVSLEDLRTAASKGVYFIGDAVHAEPILGGAGANAAIQDGISLANHIADHGVDSTPDWYAANHQRWTDGVAGSKRKIKEMHEVAKASL